RMVVPVLREADDVRAGHDALPTVEAGCIHPASAFCPSPFIYCVQMIVSVSGSRALLPEPVDAIVFRTSLPFFFLPLIGTAASPPAPRPVPPWARLTGGFEPPPTVADWRRPSDGASAADPLMNCTERTLAGLHFVSRGSDTPRQRATFTVHWCGVESVSHFG